MQRSVWSMGAGASGVFWCVGSVAAAPSSFLAGFELRVSGEGGEVLVLNEPAVIAPGEKLRLPAFDVGPGGGPGGGDVGAVWVSFEVETAGLEREVFVRYAAEGGAFAPASLVAGLTGVSDGAGVELAFSLGFEDPEWDGGEVVLERVLAISEAPGPGDVLVLDGLAGLGVVTDGGEVASLGTFGLASEPGFVSFRQTYGILPSGGVVGVVGVAGVLMSARRRGGLLRGWGGAGASAG